MKPRLAAMGAITVVAGLMWAAAVFSQPKQDEATPPPADRPPSSYLPVIEPDFQETVKKMKAAKPDDRRRSTPTCSTSATTWPTSRPRASR